MPPPLYEVFVCRSEWVMTLHSSSSAASRPQWAPTWVGMDT